MGPSETVDLLSLGSTLGNEKKGGKDGKQETERD
jgi:hypothetical protein